MSAAESRTRFSLESLVAHLADEYLERLDRGERPNISEYVRRYPEHETVLREVLTSLEAMRLVPAAEVSAAASVRLESPLSGCLGDFRIIRDVGRGGMGIVYEAEQISLSRRVALKVLPFAAALDTKQLQRFKNEAQAAAHLHHQNIVPVYSVGCERGVHYYAMQFIDGSTVASMIEEQRRLVGLEEADGASTLAAQKYERIPAVVNKSSEYRGETLGPTANSTQHSARRPDYFRIVAGLGRQAAEALEHAHELGVVHRDVKPANLLIDQRGNLWITDFGLARLRNETGLTMTGDLVGTVRYMSPEQAHSSGLADHRTDIYSLGVTLYELLTLHPAFPGHDRQDLLRRIQHEEPLAPRRLNSSIPRELETIVQKAFAKIPAERYATAQELADDLTRFLNDVPVRARRPSFADLARRWCRRHRAAVVGTIASAVVLLAIAAVILALSRSRIAQEQERTRQALAEAQASWHRAEEHRQRREADMQKTLAAIERMLKGVSERTTGTEPAVEQVRQKLLNEALHSYDSLLEEKATDATSLFETGRAHVQLARIYAVLGQAAEQEHALRRSLDLFRRATNAEPRDPTYRQALFECQVALSEYLRAIPGRQREAEPLLRQSLKLAESLSADELPGSKRGVQLAGIWHALGYLQYSAGRYRDAEESMRRGLNLMDDAAANALIHEDLSTQRAQAWNSLGLVLRAAGRPREAEKAHRHALLALNRKDTNSCPSPSELARTYAHLGIVLHVLDRPDEGLQAIRQALALRSKLAADSPLSRGERQELGLTQLMLGNLLEREHKSTEAEQAYREAVRALSQLSVEFPEQPDCLRNLALCQSSLGNALYKMGKKDEASQHFVAMFQAYQGALRLAPLSADANNNLAWSLATCPDLAHRDLPLAVNLSQKAVDLSPQQGVLWNTLGVARYRAGNYQDARRALIRSMELRGGGDPYDWLFLSMISAQLGEREAARSWYDKAASWLNRKKAIPEELDRFRQEAASLLQVGARSKPTL
jgi:serine/threonine protein kinase/Flp pilus assembly protein TadD